MSGDGANPSALEERLKADLRRAVRERDRAAVSALRAAVAAVDNAGSVGISGENHTKISGRATDVPRREPSEEEIFETLRHEIEELEAGISAFEKHGDTERAEELKIQRAVLATYIDDGV